MRAWLLLPSGFLAGSALAVQFSANAQLRTFVGARWWRPRSLSSSERSRCSWPRWSSGNRGPSPRPSQAHRRGGWAGNLLSAFYVLATVILVSRIGAATMVGLILAGQVVAAVRIDHFEWLRVPVHELNLPRVAGAVRIVVALCTGSRRESTRRRKTLGRRWIFGEGPGKPEAVWS